MAFKPLTKNKSNTELMEKKTPEQEEHERSLNTRSLPDILKSTDERIHIIFDDSSSMSAVVPGSAPAGVALTRTNSYLLHGSYDQDLSRIQLAIEGTVDYMKNCKPHITAVEIAPLNETEITLSKNLPAVAASLKKIEASGGTPLYEHMQQMVDNHKTRKYTRALIFTDGEAYPGYGVRPTLISEMKEMGIPIDFIIIGNKLESNLNPQEQEIKAMCLATGGVFMICKDGRSFKEKMKYFAPLLRHMLPAIASKEN